MTIYRRPVSRPLEILLVEADPADSRLIQLTLDDAEFHLNLTLAKSREEATSFLRGDFDVKRVPRPDLILVDMNLPMNDGRELIVELKDDCDLRGIPVLILTASDAHEDTMCSTDMSAVEYIVKPVRTDDFDVKVRELLNYLTEVSKIPAALAK